jgi:poly-beta-1,6-N-acetyl-D-glucosamine synthase
MWLLVFIFLAFTFLVGWTLFGYFIFLYWKGFCRRRVEPEIPGNLPSMSIAVPCYNEEKNIIAKLDDLRRLDYPRELLQIVFVDGGSSDHTVALLKGARDCGLLFTVLQSPRSGKIHQLNHALPALTGEIVLNTDVDARIRPDALKWIAAEFALDLQVAVVGAYCAPEKTMDIEDYHWAAQNKSRFIESDADNASIVIAQCYAFRRNFLTSFPEDVVADDVYIAFLAAVEGKRAVYSRKAMAVETRTPQTYTEFLEHKFRKSNAMLRESLRFLYRLPEMAASSKTIFLTRLAQQVLLPWALAWWMLLAGVLLILARLDMIVFGSSFLLLLFVSTSVLFRRMPLPDGTRHHSVITLIKGYAVTNFIMIATALSYPFYQQSSFYSRLQESGPDAQVRARVHLGPAQK